jgi:hypothetical protein
MILLTQKFIYDIYLYAFIQNVVFNNVHPRDHILITKADIKAKRQGILVVCFDRLFF